MLKKTAFFSRHLGLSSSSPKHGQKWDLCSKYEMVYWWSLAALCFLWCHILNSKSGTYVQNTHTPIDYFGSKAFGNATCCQKASCDIQNSEILPFTNTILLWCRSFSKLPLDSIHLTKIYKVT